METEIIKAATAQGLWAVLFVVLLFYVLKTSGEREKRLIDCVDRLSKQFEVVDDIKDGVNRIEQRLERTGVKHGGGGAP